MDILKKLYILPSQEMNIERKINYIIMLLIVFIFFLVLFNVSNKKIYILSIILFIIILLYIKMSSSIYENFTPEIKFYNKPPLLKRVNDVNLNNMNFAQEIIETPFCEDTNNVNYNNINYMSNNQKLSGPANPKTLIPPVVIPPIADLSYWKNNNLTTHSAINDNKNIDVYQSGYEVSNFCGNSNCTTNNKLNSKFDGYKYTKPKLETQDYEKESQPYYDQKYNILKENFERQNDNKLIENIGEINKSCGYNDKLLKVNLPVNIPVGKCMENQNMSKYNENLFTSTIQPGVYTTNEVNEPISSNIGISFDQQFEPLTYKVNDNSIKFTQHDPYDPLYNPENNIQNLNSKSAQRILGDDVIEPITIDNTYDPRFNGYGTSYRTYIDPLLGQPKFFYDDIDSVKMPNYITRSNIDFAKFADKYGPMKNQYGNENNSNIREFANDAFLQSALQFRTGMQERLMRKINSEQWQQRAAPLGPKQRMLGNSSYF
jgi:hypothetical protein